MAEPNNPARDIDEAPRLGMVGWYDPAQLLRTGVEVIVSTLFGRHSDSRRIDAISTSCPLLDYTGPEYRDEDGCFRFDYVADTGDGWHSTYAVAYMLSRDQCNGLRRGRLLIMGGDLVYPYPNRSRYEQRLLAPYAIAGRLHEDTAVEVLAIPGNHDWYDSLVNFRRVFLSQRISPFRTRQTRSYFAARLPANWWLFGLDTQLDHDIDEAQFKFFCELANELDPDQRVVLCIPEPVWQRRWEPRDAAAIFTRTLIETMEARLGPRIRLCVAGDSHHYQRFTSRHDGRHLVVCGSGGAFLHPTHRCPTDPTGEYTHQRSVPKQRVSSRLTFGNLLFARHNPFFGIVPAIAYLLAAWQNGLAVGECFHGGTCIREIGELGLAQWREALYAAINSALLSPTGIVLYGLIFWGFVFFADRRSWLFRYTVGTTHAMAHIVAGFLIYWFAAYVAITTLGLRPKTIEQYTVTGTLIFWLSWIVASMILGLYLLVSLNVFGKHRNEAFSAMRIRHWKGFLRFMIDRSGTLHMAFIGLRQVPRQWRPARRPGSLIWEPHNPNRFRSVIYDKIRL